MLCQHDALAQAAGAPALGGPLGCPLRQPGALVRLVWVLPDAKFPEVRGLTSMFWLTRSTGRYLQDSGQKRQWMSRQPEETWFPEKVYHAAEVQGCSSGCFLQPCIMEPTPSENPPDVADLCCQVSRRTGRGKQVVQQHQHAPRVGTECLALAVQQPREQVPRCSPAPTARPSMISSVPVHTERSNRTHSGACYNLLWAGVVAMHA